MQLLDSVVEVGKKYYPEILLEECKYAVKKKNIMNAINEELNLDKYDKDESDEENNESKDCILMVFLIFMDLIVYGLRISCAIKSIKFMYS